MKFLLDENVSQTAGRGLRDAGYDVLHVLDTPYRSAGDEEILKFAKRERRVIVTHDKDFGNLLRFPVETHAGVILIRPRNQTPPNTLRHLLKFLSVRGSLFGNLVIIRESEYRIVG